MLIGFLANPQSFGWFPSAGLQRTDTSRLSFAGMLGDYLWHLTLPLACYTYGGFAFLSKLMRASILENLYLDYARTARAKGLPGHTVLLRHVFRNSLLPLITVAAGILPGLLGGSVIVETMFSIQGMGQLAFQATLARDLPVIQALGFVTGVLVLVSYLLTDLCYAFADPRVSYD
jgi:peptide/nickel transport system permease protein